MARKIATPQDWHHEHSNRTWPDAMTHTVLSWEQFVIPRDRRFIPKRHTPGTLAQLPY
jgi:hypothetical protein